MPFPFKFRRNKTQETDTAQSLQKETQSSLNSPDSFTTTESTDIPFENTMPLKNSGWITDLNYYLNWLSEQFYRMLDYCYPDSWKTLKEYTTEELAIFKKQEHEKQLRQKLRGDLLQRSKEIRIQYDSDLGYINRRKKICENWHNLVKESLLDKRKSDDNFYPPVGSEYKQMPGWQPEKVDFHPLNNELCQALQCSASTPVNVMTTPSQSFEQQIKLRELYNQNFEYQQKLSQIQGEYEKCVNYIHLNEPVAQRPSQSEPILLEIDSGPHVIESRSERPTPTPPIPSSSHQQVPLSQPIPVDVYPLTEPEVTLFEGLLHALSVPLRIVTGDMSLGTTNIRGSIKRFFLVPVIRMILACLLLFCYWKILTFLTMIVTALLDSALSYLPKKRPSQIPNLPLEKPKSKNRKSKSKKQEEELEELEESRYFWEKHLGWLSNVIRIDRGGDLVPLQQLNIYEFSNFHKQQILWFFAPEFCLVKIERYRLELEALLAQSRFTQIQRKLSQLELQKILRLPSPILSDQFKASLLGVTIFLSSSYGNPISSRSRNFFQQDLSVPTEQFILSDLPHFDRHLNDKNSKHETEIDSIVSSTNDLAKNSESVCSRLSSVKKVRKTAKTTRLSDLPCLPTEDSNIESYSSASHRLIQVKVR